MAETALYTGGVLAYRITLTEDLKKQLRTGRGQLYEAQLADDGQFEARQLTLEVQQTSVDPRQPFRSVVRPLMQRLTVITRSTLDPKGTVYLVGELWSAESEFGEIIEDGESVVAAELDGVTFKVFRKSSLDAIERSIT